MDRRPYRVGEEPNPEGPGILLTLQAIETLPADIPIHVGAILAAQRESLDFLVTALAEKNGATEPRDTQFPIADSQARFLEKGISRDSQRQQPTRRSYSS